MATAPSGSVLRLPLPQLRNEGDELALVHHFVFAAPVTDEGIDLGAMEGQQLRLPIGPGQLLGLSLGLAADGPLVVQHHADAPQQVHGPWAFTPVAVLAARATRSVDVLLVHPADDGWRSTRVGTVNVPAGQQVAVCVATTVARGQEVA